MQSLVAIFSKQFSNLCSYPLWLAAAHVEKQPWTCVLHIKQSIALGRWVTQFLQSCLTSQASDSQIRLWVCKQDHSWINQLKPLCEKYYCHKMLGGDGKFYDTVNLNLAVVCIITCISTMIQTGLHLQVYLIWILSMMNKKRNLCFVYNTKHVKHNHHH